MTSIREEEPWEADIGAMLGGLPTVDPPPGFIDAALDHRPKYAARCVAGLCGLSVIAIALTLVTGAAGRTTVAPRIDELTQRHTAVQSGVLGTAVEVDYRVDTPIELPAGFERTHNLAAEEIRQAFYDNGDAEVSVFVQDGPVRWDALDRSRLAEVDGVRAWVDEPRNIVVVEASGATVTIIGLPVEDVGQVLESVPRTEQTTIDRSRELVEAIVGQLGFP
ncbi:MAG: hypothetical protein AAGA65_04785 [Actinomycetota bacterium]